MKRNWIKIKFVLIACFAFLILGGYSYAASLSISGATTGSPNSKVTITVTGNDLIGRINLTVSNGSVNTSSVWIENGSASVTVTLGSSGTTTVTATPVAGTSDSSGNPASIGAKSKSITIKSPVTNPTTNTPTTKPTQTTTTKPSVNKPTNNTNTSTKSSNNNLKSLILSVEGMSPAFSKNILSYSLNVGENVDKVNVRAAVEHSRASYSVTGNTNLKDGENIISIKVTAENGAVKTYTVRVVKSDDPVKSDATLSSLIIEDLDLGQTFDPNVTEYNAGEIKTNNESLKIFTATNNEKAKVEIIGNEDLKDGENKIIVRVTSENGKITKDYIVNFTKSPNDIVDSLSNKSLNNSKDNQKPSLLAKIKDIYNDVFKEKITIILLYFFVWLEFIQVVYLYEKLKKVESNDETKKENVKEEKISRRKGVHEDEITKE